MPLLAADPGEQFPVDLEHESLGQGQRLDHVEAAVRSPDIRLDFGDVLDVRARLVPLLGAGLRTSASDAWVPSIRVLASASRVAYGPIRSWGSRTRWPNPCR